MLTGFCQLATSLLRPTDLFGRIGGEEFAIFLPDMIWQDAVSLAERLRASFEATSHTIADQPLTATVSVGVAISDDVNIDLSALLEAADQALYCAKAHRTASNYAHIPSPLPQQLNGMYSYRLSRPATN